MIYVDDSSVCVYHRPLNGIDSLTKICAYLMQSKSFLFGFLENNCTYNDPVGRSYMGKKYTTVGNKQCADWSNQLAYRADDFPDGSYDGASNYCRNPRPYEDRTWCYWDGRRWDFCLLENCGKYYSCH